MLSTHIALLATLLAAEPVKAPVAYSEASDLERLECLESWEQLCTPFLGGGPSHRVVVSDDAVTVDFFLDEPFVFRIERRSGLILDLVMTCGRRKEPCSGKGEKARLEMRRDGTATFDVPDFWHLEDGTHKRKTVQLVPFDKSSMLHDDLERQFVPGGRCQGLMGYQVAGNRPCINKPGSSARSLPPTKAP